MTVNDESIIGNDGKAFIIELWSGEIKNILINLLLLMKILVNYDNYDDTESASSTVLRVSI